MIFSVTEHQTELIMIWKVAYVSWIYLSLIIWLGSRNNQLSLLSICELNLCLTSSVPKYVTFKEQKKKRGGGGDEKQ